MSRFTVHDPSSAPAESRAILEQAKKKMGFTPNLFGVFAAAPAALKAYTTLSELFDSTSFSATQRQVILLAASRENGCTYCVAVHSTLAQKAGLDQDSVQALRAGREPSDRKLAALATFTRSLVREKGWVAGQDLEAFLAAGYAPPQIMEVILGLSLKTLSNYTNHLADTPLDEAFKPAAWSPEREAQAS